MSDKDPYYNRDEVSNSDLSELAKYWMAGDVIYDIEQAYAFGSLLDAMITEQHKINYFKLCCDGRIHTKEEFKLAEEMKAAFWKDEFCAMMAKHSEMQSIVAKDNFAIEYEGFKFYLSVRLKFDLDARKKLNMTGDIKSTAAETEKQFIAACHHFQYFRQRAWYMDISGSDRDMLIGISKVNKKVFKVPIKRGSEFYNIGKAQYQELAWKWFQLFGDYTNISYIDNLKIAI